MRTNYVIVNFINIFTLIKFEIIIHVFVIIFLINRDIKDKKLMKQITNFKCNKAIIAKNKCKKKCISPHREADILKQLVNFELNKKFLEKKMNLTKMAKILKTNTKYVSIIISKYRNKGTIQYITDLRLDYIIQLLINEPKYRNYTYKALADEAGFGSTYHFSTAFRYREKLTPIELICILKTSNSNKEPIV